MRNARPVTFNMPIFLHHELRVFAGSKRMSKFVCEAIKQKLEEEKKKLKNAYIDSEKDRKRKDSIKEWSQTEGENWND